jgi:hypothetical protein
MAAGGCASGKVAVDKNSLYFYTVRATLQAKY